MPELPQVIGFMSILEPVFTKPAFITCIRLVTGWILCPARRTITGMYPFADPKRENCVDVYHYFFRAAAWLQCELFACWASFLVDRLCAGQKTLLLAIDDTTHKKTGRKVDGARVCRDAVRSTTSETVFQSRRNWRRRFRQASGCCSKPASGETSGNAWCMSGKLCVATWILR